MPWLRLDGLLLLIIWVTPYYKAAPHQAIYAWKLAGVGPLGQKWRGKGIGEGETNLSIDFHPHLPRLGRWRRIPRSLHPIDPFSLFQLAPRPRP